MIQLSFGGLNRTLELENFTQLNIWSYAGALQLNIFSPIYLV